MPSWRSPECHGGILHNGGGMMKRNDCIRGALGGLLYGAEVLGASSLLLWGAGSLCRTVAPGAEEIALILDQLRGAEAVSPWEAVLLAGALLGAGFAWAVGSRRRRGLIAACVGVPLFLPLTVAVLLCTRVNGICPAAFLVPAPKEPEYAAET